MSNLEILVSYRPDLTLEVYQQAGASGVVCSLSYDSTRSSHYCDWEQVVEVIQNAHALGMKVYLLINRIYTEEECNGLYERMRVWFEQEIDGIYYSDPAVYMMALDLDKEDQLIYNQDTILTNRFDVQNYCDLNVARCMISHEITLEEIVQMLDHVKGELEYVCFGHLNLSYSKRHLLSCYFDEIQLQKDVTQVYEIEEESRKERFLIQQDEQGTSIFTKEIFDATEQLDVLRQHGLRVVRIDGVYLSREQLESAIKHVARKEPLTESCWNEVTFTKGYLYQKTNISK